MFWQDFWAFIWYVFIIFVFVAYIYVLVMILTDLFRDEDESGWAKAAWILFLIIFPIITALIYLIVRGDGMAKRAQKAAIQYKRDTDAYIQQVAHSDSPADQIAKAKQLLNDGTIDQDEYNKLKAKALA